MESVALVIGIALGGRSTRDASAGVQEESSACRLRGNFCRDSWSKKLCLEALTKFTLMCELYV